MGEVEIKSFTLELQNRESNNELTIEKDQLITMLENDSQKTVELFQQLVRGDSFKHDKAWLLMIIDWTPRDGLPISEMVKWMDLAVRANAIDVRDSSDNGLVEFKLSPKEANLLWERIKNPNFKIQGTMEKCFWDFLKHFMAKTGNRFDHDHDES